MGKGIALEFKRRYPAMFKQYTEDCKTGKLAIGKPSLHCSALPWILNFPTKLHWRSISQLEFINAGLESLVSNAPQWGLTSLALPALGCGLGGLRWREVAPVILTKLKAATFDIEIYAPNGVPQEEMDVEYLSNLFGK